MTAGEFTPEVKITVDGRALGRCEVCGNGCLTYEYHHRRPRGSGGSRAADTGSVANCLAVCRECHRMIEKHRTVAKLMGWLIPQGWSPLLQRVMYRGEWAALTDDGQVVPLENAA